MNLKTEIDLSHTKCAATDGQGTHPREFVGPNKEAQ